MELVDIYQFLLPLSGVGRSIWPDWPRQRCRTSAIATSVPRTSATAVDTAATLRLSLSASVSGGYLNGCAQLFSVKPCQL